MLNFEEDISPVPQPFRANAPAPTIPAPAEVDDNAKSRRVRVEDKRIINGSADVNQLVPFKYKWAW